jgi:spermidine synthase
MTDASTITSETEPATTRLLPLLLLLFVGSGCAALIYEIVWFQLLQLVIGSSAVSLGVLLATFMGGMCAGSLYFSRAIGTSQHPLRTYALLELGIGFFGIVVSLGVPHISGLYAASFVHGFAGILLRGLFCAVCLLPPTILMGATLPAIARWVEATPTGISWLGFFYGGNIAGAVFGCLLAGFYLLRVHDMETATYVAVAINVAVASIALAVAARAAHVVTPVSAGAEPVAGVPGASLVYVTIALSGFNALGAEVVWTRVMSLMLGATVYTFSIILAVVLLGLGLGSTAGSIMARGRRPRLSLGLCQLVLTVAIAWTAYAMAQSLPFWPINPSLSTDPWLYFQLDIARCIWALLPATLLWGASFPLSLSSIASRTEDPARLVGRVYAANTAGAIAGAIAFSMIVIPRLGTQQAQRLLIVTAAISSLLMLVPFVAGQQSNTSLGGLVHRGWRLAGAVGLVIAVGGTVALVRSVAAIPDGLVAYGRFLPTYWKLPDFLYVGEGMNSSIAVSQLDNGARNFHVSGKVEASTEPQDMRLQRMLGALAALVHPAPKTVLVVGFGAGVTAGTFVPYPGISRIVICEIEPLIPEHVGPYFAKENYSVWKDPRVEIVYDDARHYILTTREKFDIITSDPIHPWVKGAATLYTKEYFDLVRQHLNPGGVITEWVPLYESHSDAVKSEIATFMSEFPGGTVWANNMNSKGYDLVLLGRNGPATIDINDINRRLARPDHATALASLRDVGFESTVDLFATFSGDAAVLAPWLANAEINRDRNLRLQYLAGLGNNIYQNAGIYDELAKYRKFPDALFTAPDEWKAAVRQAMFGAP